MYAKWGGLCDKVWSSKINTIIRKNEFKENPENKLCDETTSRVTGEKGEGL